MLISFENINRQEKVVEAVLQKGSSRHLRSLHVLLIFFQIIGHFRAHYSSFYLTL